MELRESSLGVNFHGLFFEHEVDTLVGWLVLARSAQNMGLSLKSFQAILTHVFFLCLISTAAIARPVDIGSPSELGTPEGTVPVLPTGKASTQKESRETDSIKVFRKGKAASNQSAEELEKTALPFLGMNVKEIVFLGNERIATRFLLQQLTFQQGSRLKENDIFESVQNLRNTKIIKTINIELIKLESGDVKILILIDELWTTIPFVLFSTGGGSVLVVTGIVDSNLFGFGSTGWVTYQYLDGLSSWIGKIRYPNLLQSDYEVTAEFWKEEKNNEIRSFTANKELLAGYTSYQETYSLLVKRPFDFNTHWLPKFNSGLGLRYSNWSFNDRKLSPEGIERNSKENFKPPPGTERLYYVFESDLGRVNFNGNFADGAALTYRYSYGEPLRKNTGRYSEHFVMGRFFRTLPREVLFASRLEAQFRISDKLADEDMMGGLFHVRGLPNDIFRGLSLWFYNAEMRRFVYKQQYAHLQAVVFQDAGNTYRTRSHDLRSGQKYRPRGILNSKEGGFATSVGAGFRVLFPDISELALRVDYGWLLSPFKTSGLSLGVVQFVR